MRAAVLQDSNEVAGAIYGLMKRSRTNLTRICRENDLDYQKTYREIHGSLIKLEKLKSIASLIDPEIELNFSIDSVSLDVEISFSKK